MGRTITPVTAAMLAVIWLAPMLLASTWADTSDQRVLLPHQYTTADSFAAPVTPWLRATNSTSPSNMFTLPSQPDPIDPAFARYYAAHAGASTLGTPLTPALPTTLGRVQFFTSGALLLPIATTPTIVKKLGPLFSSTPSSGATTASATVSPDIDGAAVVDAGNDSATSADEGASDTTPAATPSSTTVNQEAQVLSAADGIDPLKILLRQGRTDAATNVVELPLLSVLLSIGSLAPVGGPTSSMTYVDLRRATLPGAMVPVPTRAVAEGKSEFIAEASQAGIDLGHSIPTVLWQYINQPDVSPHGWETDLGQPLSEALPLTAMRDGSLHRLQAQVFWHGVLLIDRDALDASGQPTVSRLDTGAAYLATIGTPDLVVNQGQRLWTLGATALLSAPGNGSAKAHVGPAFLMTLTGSSRWVDSALWYQVRWKTPHTTNNAWVSAAAATFTAPGPVSSMASFDVLSTELAQYLAQQGDETGVVLYDLTRKQYYTYNVDGQFIMASSAKVPIMLTFLTMTESQGREPDDNEMSLLTTMIENSNNDSAQALFDAIGGAPAMDAFMQQVGVPGLVPNPDAWGWSTISPLAMVRLLTMLHDGKVLTAQDRTLALTLMQNIESDQQIGVGDTAPQGASVAMKDGWVPGPDDLWAMNSSGIVTIGNETYVLAVYTQHKNSLDEGWAITREVSSRIAKLLV